MTIQVLVKAFLHFTALKMNGLTFYSFSSKVMFFVILYFFRGLLCFGSSPKTLPQGCKPSTRSKIIFKIARKGILKNIPEIPHNSSPSKSPIKVKRALILTLEPTTNGKGNISINCVNNQITHQYQKRMITTCCKGN